MKTITIIIGNIHDQLGQFDWSQFASRCQYFVEAYARRIQFKGGPSWGALYQNYCWVIELDAGSVRLLRDALSQVLAEFGVSELLISVGDCELVNRERKCHA